MGLPLKDSKGHRTLRPAALQQATSAHAVHGGNNHASQAPDSQKGRMYKVLKEVIQENSQASKGNSSVIKLISLGGRLSKGS